MGKVTVEAWKCDLCGHVWIKQPGVIPKQCAKCRTRIWNCDQDEKPKQMIIEKPTKAESPTERAKEIVRDPEPAKAQKVCRSCKAPLKPYKDGVACVDARCIRYGIVTP